MPPKKKPDDDAAIHAVGHADPVGVPDPRLAEAAALLEEAGAEIMRLTSELADARENAREEFQTATPEQWQKIKRQCGDTVDDAAAIVVTLDLVRAKVEPKSGEDLDTAVDRAIEEAAENARINAEEAAKLGVEKVTLLLDRHGILGPAWRRLHLYDQQTLEGEITQALTDDC